MQLVPPTPRPEQCRFCTAPEKYLEWVETGWLCRVCARINQPPKDAPP
jgi:hypothetical protein